MDIVGNTDIILLEKEQNNYSILFLLSRDYSDNLDLHSTLTNLFSDVHPKLQEKLFSVKLMLEKVWFDFFNGFIIHP